MKNFLQTLLAAAIIWIALQAFGPDLLRLDWVNHLRPVAPASSPAPVTGTSPAAVPSSSLSPAASGALVVGGSPAPPSSPVATPLPVAKPETLAAVVVITGSEGAGTGFVCNFRGKTYVATNQHVLGVGNPLTIRTSTGMALGVRRLFAATDADIALLEPAALPPGTTSLTVATLPDPGIRPNDPTLVLGNSQGDGVVTQTPGKLLAVGPQRIEVNNPVYPGNSGSPILDVPTGQVIGVLTEAEMVTLNEFEKASFRSKDSTIKTTVRYFGHRLDSVQGWEPLDWTTYQDTEALLRQSRTELLALFGYLSDTSTAYKRLPEIHGTINAVDSVFADEHESTTDKLEAFDRFLRDLERYARRAKARFDGRKIYFQQREKVDTVRRLSDTLLAAVAVARRDNSVAQTLFSKQQ